LAPKAAGFVLGVVKAYSTRVGAGPFPSESAGPISDRLRTIGHEFGVNTGRPRRCGWFDAVAVRKAVEVGGINGIALTKLDVLDDFEELKICTSYELDGSVIDYLPASLGKVERLKPIYETMEGWSASTRGKRALGDLPSRAVAYLRRLEKLCGVSVVIVGTGQERDDLIVLQDIL
jgi:adenylosuccinate synthase